MSKTYSAGIVTAYGAAKRAGYQGTYEDFCRQQAGYAGNAAAVEAAKTAAQTARNQAQTAKDDAVTAKNTAVSAKDDAVSAKNTAVSAKDDAVSAKNTASTKAQEASASATSAGLSATSASQSAQNAEQSAQGISGSLAQIQTNKEDIDTLKADLSESAGDLKSAFVNLSDGNQNSMIYAKFYDGYYNSTLAYTGTNTEGKSSHWGVCVIPVPKDKKITVSGFTAQSGARSVWLNSNDPADVNSLAFLSQNNNGEKTCKTGWLGISDWNYAGNIGLVNYAYIDDIRKDIQTLEGYENDITESLAYFDVMDDCTGQTLVDFSNVTASKTKWAATKVLEGLTFTSGQKYKLLVKFDSIFDVSGYARIYDSNDTEKYITNSFSGNSYAVIEFKPSSTITGAYVTVAYNSATPHRFMTYVFSVDETNTEKELNTLTSSLAETVISNDRLRNGSVVNTLNNNFVATPVIFTKSSRVIVSTDRPNSENCVYRYQFYTALVRHKDIAGKPESDRTGAQEENNNVYDTANGCVGIQVAITEYNTTTSSQSPLRVDDFIGYKIYIDANYVSKTETLIDGVPEYYDDYIQARLETVKEKDILIGNSGISFVFITDPHIYSPASNKYYSPLLAEYIINNSSVNTLIYGGDYINEPSSKTLAIQGLYKAVARCRVFDDVIFMRGNHETNPYGTGTLTGDEVYAILNKHIEKYIVTDKHNYYYFDNVSQKVRVTILDTAENGDVDSDQLSWFTSKVAELDSNWKIVILSHIAINSQNKDNRVDITETNVVSKIRTAVSNISATVICWICGHTHLDLSEKVDSFPIISVTCDANGVQASTRSTDDRTVGTINEEAFDVFHIDSSNKKVYATRIGGGQYNVRETGDYTDNDREWSYQ